MNESTPFPVAAGVVEVAETRHSSSVVAWRALKQTRESQSLPVPLPNGHGWVSADGFASLDVAHHATFASNPRARANGQMIADSRLSTDHYPIADFSTSGDTDLSTQD